MKTKLIEKLRMELKARGMSDKEIMLYILRKLKNES